jgi:hypothetical protein
MMEGGPLIEEEMNAFDGMNSEFHLNYNANGMITLCEDGIYDPLIIPEDNK